MSTPKSSSSLVNEAKSLGRLLPAIEPVGQVIPGRSAGAGHDAGEPPGLHRIVTPGLILRAIGRRWLEAVAVGFVLAAVATTAVWMARPDKYTAYAVLRVSSSDQKILRDSSQAPDWDNSYARTQLALLRSRAVFRTALKDEAVRQLPILAKHADPIEFLEKEFKAVQLDGTDLVQASLTSRESKDDLAHLVNAITKAYLADAVKQEQANQEGRLNDLQMVYKNVEDKLRNFRSTVNNLAQDMKGDNKALTPAQQEIVEDYGNLKRDLAANLSKDRDLDIKMAISRLRLAPAAGTEKQGNPLMDKLIEMELDMDPRIVEQQKQVSAAQERLKNHIRLAQGSESSEPIKKQIEKQIEDAKDALRTLREEVRTSLVARRKVMTEANVAAAIQDMEYERAGLQEYRKYLEKRLEQRKKDLDSLGIGTATAGGGGLNSVELDLRRAEVKRYDQLLDLIGEQKERIELEIKGPAGRQRVSMVAPAEEATILNKYGRIQEAGSAGALAFLLGVFAVGYRDFRRGRIYSPVDVSRGLRMRVIGSLPILPGGALGDVAKSAALSRVSAAGKYGTGLVESVDGIRTMIMHEFLAGKGKGTILMVASASPGEGKTTVATEVAASLARANCRTLLIDGDLRVPSLHQLFAIPQSPGLCDLLSGIPLRTEGPPEDVGEAAVWGSAPASLDDVIRETAFANLHILPAGNFCPVSATAMAQPANLHRLFDSLRGRYDFIIIDSSPVLLVPDALMFGRCADGLLLSVRPGVSEVTEVYAGYERLREYRLPFLGVVVNGVPVGKGYVKRYGEPTAPVASTADVTS